MRLSQRLQDEVAWLLQNLAGEICPRCHATLASFADQCSADLDDPCPGFMALDAAKAEFNRNYNPKRS